MQSRNIFNPAWIALLHKQMNCAQDHRNLDGKKVEMVFYLLKISALGFSQKANTAPRRKEDSNLFHHFHYNTQSWVAKPL